MTNLHKNSTSALYNMGISRTEEPQQQEISYGYMSKHIVLIVIFVVVSKILKINWFLIYRNRGDCGNYDEFFICRSFSLN